MSAEIPNRRGKMEGKGKNHKSRDCIAKGAFVFAGSVATRSSRLSVTFPK